MRRIALLAVSIVFCCAVFAGEQGKPKIFKAAMTTNPASLDEGISNSNFTRQISIYVYETLFTFGEDYRLIPQLADSFTKSGTDFVITVRKDAVFHNGKKMTAADVKASVERFMKTGLAGTRFTNLKEIEIIDEHTLKFVMTKDMILPEELALPSRVVIMPAEIAERLGKNEVKAQDMIGTGPYKLVEWKSDIHVKLAKFDEYVPDERYDGADGFGGKRVAHFDEVYFIPAPEAESRISGLETGAFDFAEAIPATSYSRLADNKKISLEVVKPRWAVVVELNHVAPFMKDAKFRRALVHALDMDKVMKAVTTGRKEFYRLQPSIFTPEQFFYTEKGSTGIYNNYDLDKAKALLKEAGYNGEELVYLYNKDFDWMYKAALAMADQWKKAGINVVLEMHDWPSQIKKAQTLKEWAINQSGWSPRFDPSQTNGYFSSSSIGSYGYNNPKMDQLLVDLTEGRPSDERKALWEELQELVWDDVTVIRVGDYFELEGINAKYKGYKSYTVFPRFWNVHE